MATGKFTTIKEASVELPNGKRLTAQLTESNFEGTKNTFVSLRSWFRPEEGQGGPAWLPEKKGVTFSPQVLSEVIEALGKLQ